jgi:hypothetical protein
MTDLPPFLPAPSVPPSAFERFLKYGFSSGGPFPSTPFAAHFGLTAREAKIALDRLVTEGVLSFVGIANNIETWSPSKDGFRAFGMHGPKPNVTKATLAAAKDVLAAWARQAPRPDVLEISLGGRPIRGARNGRLAIGVQLDHPPFIGPEDAKLYGQIAEVVEEVLPAHAFSVRIFQDKVPARLATRLM